MEISGIANLRGLSQPLCVVGALPRHLEGVPEKSDQEPEAAQVAGAAVPGLAEQGVCRVDELAARVQVPGCAGAVPAAVLATVRPAARPRAPPPGERHLPGQGDECVFSHMSSPPACASVHRLLSWPRGA